MAASTDERLCNGIPIDHRLREFLPKAKSKDCKGVGNHAEIVEGFGRTMVRRDSPKPSDDEAGFAGWLAKPDTTGGLVIALLQPNKTHDYKAGFQKVKDDCPTLVYLEQALESIIGPGGLVATSVFDAFPFVTDCTSPEMWTEESRNAYSTFIAMLEAKRPELVFACWRVESRRELPFSRKGVGQTDQVWHHELSNGHVVRIVNGFHPSFSANYNPNESCFRKLFTLELCKAFCELNSAWKEEIWMKCLRARCRRRVRELQAEDNKDGGQRKTKYGRLLRDLEQESRKKCNAYKDSFDSGLQCIKQIFAHLVPSEHTIESPWGFYNIFRDENTSEGLCDALLAVSEALKRFKPDHSISDLSPVELRELRNHINDQTRYFVEDYVPNLLNRPRGLNRSLWRSQFRTSKSRELRSSLETVTIKLFEDIVDSIPYLTKSELTKPWTFDPDLLNAAFKEFAIGFEESLGEEYDRRQGKNQRDRQQIGVGNYSEDIDRVTSVLSSISISGSPNAESAKLARNAVSPRSTSSVVCFKCGGPGHDFKSCEIPKNGSTTPPRRYSTSTSTSPCHNCNEEGHWAKHCPSPKKQRQRFGKML